MSAKLFVGNLSFGVTENDLQDAFAAHGTVVEANLMMDRATGRPPRADRDWIIGSPGIVHAGVHKRQCPCNHWRANLRDTNSLQRRVIPVGHDGVSPQAR